MYYTADHYLDYPAVEVCCRALAEAHPEWMTIEETGLSREGRPLLLITLSLTNTGGLRERPGFWLDAGTHASEFTSVMSALFNMSRWLERLAEGDEAAREWFSQNAIYIVPCVSPDGFQAMCEGAAFLRSSLREAPSGAVRSGFDGSARRENTGSSSITSRAGGAFRSAEGETRCTRGCR